jgi:Domain of unknown function (DUF222)
MSYPFVILNGMDDLSGVPLERIEAELVAHAEWEATGMARMLAVLGEFDRREGWHAWGCVSPQQWLSWKCGLGVVAASERLRVARVLPNLPVISDAFSRGKLSWSKVREITRIAQPVTDEDLCDLAMAATAAQVAKIVRAMRRVTAVEAAKQVESRGCSWHVDDDASLVVVLKVPAEIGAVVINAIKRAAVPVKGVPYRVSAADALVDLILGDAEVHAEVVVHVEADRVAIEDGPAIAPEIAEALACNGCVSTVVETPNGPVEIDRRRAATRLQRRWLGLRHRECQIDGCHHAGRFDVHHVVERAKGGRTVLTNLVRICSAHHRLIHLHHLTVRLNPDRTITLLFPAGNPVDRPIERLAFQPATPESGYLDRWAGDRLDLDWIVTGLLHNAELGNRS